MNGPWVSELALMTAINNYEQVRFSQLEELV